MNKKFLIAMLNVLTLCIVIAAVSIFFVSNANWIGLVLIALAGLCLASLIPFKVKLKTVLPDIFFGLIDNGILAILAIFGGHFGGVAGAIIGGVVGNAITDGIAGIFEGHMAEKLRERFIPEERTMLKSAVGKMAGCLLGAGVVLAVNSIVEF
ncbi:MAG: hypothetical protein US83_C0004G0103 [Candidatus Falkowbacteria bacterium GW2011_GWC2_38_22]|uniref:Integral membrane protein n=1 Tax=Candidatus Falkowbacteria bacterium GW2011_GWE1_38_31 TaxID=1618638 RepID=A0A0G0MA00_9BACT|nr:MAG: hypothetical protein US73_C0002G0014 [Candidatus Falkowbacteria bacterium GW2011_GWF2_38_1205]KKQ61719.1 MAG: hypothetical protein US83_C0004G0103 [Candidatus Falkowbacteria bacterium GW2011_GWC2_38_22]KKQ63666.1 MAG: hypothetical protein US84_C0004G0014 [Candidatus Falkowbacteria bacterium GW2011_GWF1_38_22]KKQ65918.1 MAG: hypothetical protein US87_C0004G0103 [Candidatus Falkowbacteria bacterium GW2011_GWE2_38_254]KKQ70529.1 MAG: hypothetical protein US91_C0004G0014 [Candidatus Falkowb